jgi:hypothetical protein|tara:strand:- start:1923 stop:2288 length:366 start_codon:yes stop_codon:yes gene_type:complete
MNSFKKTVYKQLKLCYNRSITKEKNMSDIKLYRLTTGEEIVARYVGDYPDGHYVQNPIAMYAAEEGKIGFMPFMPYTDAADGLEIKDTNIVFILNPIPEIIAQYEQATSTIMVPPKQGIIV